MKGPSHEDSRQTSSYKWPSLQLGFMLRRFPISFFLILFLAWSSLQVSLAKQCPSRLSDEEFSQVIQRLSEDPGFFNSDNLVSNESSYLQVLGKLRDLKVSGGVYVGVGPEQNFTYIVKSRPSLAIIFDIRRQNLVFHLLFKTLFEMSWSRSEYISNLFCKPLPGNGSVVIGGDLDRLLDFFEMIGPDENLYARNLSRIESHIQKHQFPLRPSDLKAIRDIYREFFDNQFAIRFRSFGRPMYRFYPSFKEITLQRDMEGNLGNYLSSEEDFQYLKQLHGRNLIIPVVGDFAGPKALKAIGNYVRGIGETISVFYVSNVEFYLIQNGVFDRYGQNIKDLPIDEKSLFIRAYFRFPHPERLPGYISATLLQKITNFVQLFDAGRYLSYQELGLTDYVGFRE